MQYVSVPGSEERVLLLLVRRTQKNKPTPPQVLGPHAFIHHIIMNPHLKWVIGLRVVCGYVMKLVWKYSRRCAFRDLWSAVNYSLYMEILGDKDLNP
jgi:hypothetical protein